MFVVSVFRREVNDNPALLGCYATGAHSIPYFVDASFEHRFSGGKGKVIPLQA